MMQYGGVWSDAIQYNMRYVISVIYIIYVLISIAVSTIKLKKKPTVPVKPDFTAIFLCLTKVQLLPKSS